MEPTITVITAVLNNKVFIEDAINSVLSQTYPQIEYIVIDGASTDGTADIIKGYESKISKWISEPDNGIFDALNKGIKLATGDVIGFLHSDDIFSDNKVVEKIADKFASPGINIVYSDLVYVKRSDVEKVIRYWKAGKFSTKSLNYGWMPPHPTIFARKSLYVKTGLFDTGLKIASDYDMVLRLFKNNSDSVAYMNNISVKMRLGGKSNKSLNHIIQKSTEDYNILKKNGFKSPPFTLLCKNLRKVTQFI